jgi:hypothetical protein
MSDRNATGSCLCGKVTYQISGPPAVFQYCHCSRCRKFTGSAFGANLIVPPEGFRWLSGEDLVGRFALEGARHFATSFCRSCGSSLPWLTQSGRAVVVPAGTLDSDPGVRPQQNVFFGSRARWYTEPGEIPAHDELPPKT